VKHVINKRPVPTQLRAAAWVQVLEGCSRVTELPGERWNALTLASRPKAKAVIKGTPC